MRRGRLTGKRMMTRRKKLKNENAAFMDEVWMLDRLGRLESSRYAYSNRSSVTTCGCVSHIDHKASSRSRLKARSYSRLLIVPATLFGFQRQTKAMVLCTYMFPQSV